MVKHLSMLLIPFQGWDEAMVVCVLMRGGGIHVPLRKSFEKFVTRFSNVLL